MITTEYCLVSKIPWLALTQCRVANIRAIISSVEVERCVCVCIDVWGCVGDSIDLCRMLVVFCIRAEVYVICMKTIQHIASYFMYSGYDFDQDEVFRYM